jgi:hypothetical protein
VSTRNHLILSHCSRPITKPQLQIASSRDHLRHITLHLIRKLRRRVPTRDYIIPFALLKNSCQRLKTESLDFVYFHRGLRQMEQHLDAKIRNDCPLILKMVCITTRVSRCANWGQHGQRIDFLWILPPGQVLEATIADQASMPSGECQACHCHFIAFFHSLAEDKLIQFVGDSASGLQTLPEFL